MHDKGLIHSRIGQAGKLNRESYLYYIDPCLIRRIVIFGLNQVFFVKSYPSSYLALHRSRWLPSIVSVCLCILFTGWTSIASAIQSASPKGELNLENIRVHLPNLENQEKLSQVFYIEPDGKGFVWAAGIGGLFRYDGYNLEEFELENGVIEGVAVTPKLMRQANGTLWASNTRLHRFDELTQTFEWFASPDDKGIASMQEDGKGNIWVANTENSISRFVPETGGYTDEFVVHAKNDEGVDQQAIVYRFHFDQVYNRFWIVTSQGIFHYYLADKSIKFLPSAFDTIAQSATAARIACQNKFCWIGSFSGLIRIDKKTGESKLFLHNHQDPTTVAANYIASLHVDENDQLWVGTDKKGVSLYQSKKQHFVHIPVTPDDPDQMPAAAVFDISSDGENYWIALNTYGFRRISPQFDTIKRITPSQTSPVPLSFGHTLGLLEDGDKLWIATDGGGINIWNRANDTIEYLLHDPNDSRSLSSNSVIYLERDYRGRIWASTWGGGINIIDPDTYQIEHLRNDPVLPVGESLRLDNVFVMRSDGKKGMWLSTWNFGIQYYDISSASFTNYFSNSRNGDVNLNSENVMDIVEHDGQLWVSGSSGIERFNSTTGKFEHFIHGPSFYLRDIHFRGEKAYAANNTGLIEIDLVTRDFRVLAADKGERSTDILSISEDLTGRLWLGTANGVLIYEPEAEETLLITEADGLVSDKLDIYGNLVGNDGKVYLGGKLGLNVIDPDEISINQITPESLISQIEIVDKNYQTTLLTKPIELDRVSRTEFHYNENSFTFHFLSTNLSFPEKNRYRYRLEGQEQEYTEVSARKRFAEYTNLAPGNYTFEVFASNNSDVWDPVGDQYRFVIQRPWWATWWAYLLFALMLLSIVWMFSAWRVAASRAKRRELAELVQAKTYELNVLNQGLEERVIKRTKELSVEVEERRLAEAKLYHMAFHDALTGLPNRPWLSKKLEALIQKLSETKDFQFGLMFLDGDRFKHINDTYGHVVGDNLLKATTARLSNLLVDGQHAIRLGGDEFTILVEDVLSIEPLEKLAQQIVNEFKAPFNLGKISVNFGMSCGVLLVDDSYSTVSAVLRDADLAMYEAKAHCKGEYVVFDRVMREQSNEYQSIESDLKTALDNEEFILEYQPITSVNRSEPLKIEVLLRWDHPERGRVSPSKFIPIAEEMGIMVSIGRWVMTKVFEDFEKNPQFNIQYCINISSSEIKDPELHSFLIQSFGRYKISPRDLMFEATEQTVMENASTVRKSLIALDQMGINLAIDDFGKGYTSLSYLKELPIKTVKIDRQFIGAMLKRQESDDGQRLVRATIILAHSLKMEIVAQGVETEEQLAILNAMGCDYMQGFHLGQPVSFALIEQFIDDY